MGTKSLLSTELHSKVNLNGRGSHSNGPHCCIRTPVSRSDTAQRLRLLRLFLTLVDRSVRPDK